MSCEKQCILKKEQFQQRYKALKERSYLFSVSCAKLGSLSIESRKGSTVRFLKGGLISFPSNLESAVRCPEITANLSKNAGKFILSEKIKKIIPKKNLRKTKNLHKPPSLSIFSSKPPIEFFRSFSLIKAESSKFSSCFSSRCILCTFLQI